VKDIPNLLKTVPNVAVVLSTSLFQISILRSSLLTAVDVSLLLESLNIS